MVNRGILALSLLALVGAGCSTDPAVQEAKSLARGKKFLEQKDYARATLEFRNASKVKPKDAEPWYQLGLAYLGSNQPEQAVGALRQATALNPQHAAAQLKLSQMMVQSRLPEVLEDAVKRLDQVLTAEPDQPEALDALALADLKLKKPDDAVKLLQQALAKSPSHVRSAAALAAIQYSKHDLAAAEQTLKQTIEQAPKSPDASLALGQLYLLEQKRSDAEAQLRRALQLDPANVQALLMLGALQMSEGSTNAAEETYRKLSSLPNAGLSHAHAVFLFQQGQRERAILELQQLANAHPNDRAARLRLVGAYTATGKMTEAMQYLAGLLKTNSKDTEALLLRSRVYLGSGQVKEAEQDLQAVLHYQPDSADAHYGLSRVYAIQGLERSRWQQLSEVLRINPGLMQPRIELAKGQVLGGQATTALGTLDAAPAQQKNSIAMAAARNWALLALNRTDEVAAAVEQGLRAEKSPDLLLQRGILKSMKKDYAGARLDAEEVLRMNPAHTGAVNLAIQTCLAQNQKPQALEILRETTAKNARSPVIYSFVGQWLQRLGKPDEAREAFQMAKSLNARYTTADLNMAALDAQQGNVGNARTVLSHIIQSEPENENARLMLAGLDYTAGNLAGALAHFRAVLQVNPDNVVALNGAAYLGAAQDSDTALKQAQHALDLSPGNPAVEDTLGWIYYRKGLYDRAVEMLSAAVAKQPTAIRQYHLALSYMKTGDKIHAGQNMEQALAKDPKVAEREVNQ